MSRTCLPKNSILGYISLKIANLGIIGNYDAIVTSYMECLYFLVCKERGDPNYTMAPNKHTSGVHISSSRGLQQPPSLISRVSKNFLLRRGLTTIGI